MGRSGAPDPDSVRPVTDEGTRDEGAVVLTTHVDDVRWHRTLLEGLPG